MRGGGGSLTCDEFFHSFYLNSNALGHSASMSPAIGGTAKQSGSVHASCPAVLDLNLTAGKNVPKNFFHRTCRFKWNGGCHSEKNVPCHHQSLCSMHFCHIWLVPLKIQIDAVVNEVSLVNNLALKLRVDYRGFPDEVKPEVMFAIFSEDYQLF